MVIRADNTLILDGPTNDHGRYISRARCFSSDCCPRVSIRVYLVQSGWRLFWRRENSSRAKRAAGKPATSCPRKLRFEADKAREVERHHTKGPRVPLRADSLVADKQPLHETT